MTPLPWLGIEIRHLVALAVVARTGSFRRAAEELGYVQSAISQQIAQLERLVGRRLVERSPGAKTVRLTSAGELLLEHVEQIVGCFRAAQADVSAVRDVPHSELRLGLFGGLAARLLPALMQRLGVAAPTTRVVPVDAAGDAALFAQLEDGRLDVAFVERPLVAGAFDSQQLHEDPWVLLVQAGSPLARTPVPPTLEELARLPLIGVSGSRSQASVLRWMGELGLRPRVAASAESELTAQSFVRAGLGVALVPRLAAAVGDQVIAVGLGDAIPPRTLALCWLRQRRRLQGLDELCAIADAVTREDQPAASLAA